MTNRPIHNQADTVAQAFEQPNWYVNGYAANIRVRCETVQTYVGNRTFERVLDIGCGDGSLSRPFVSPSCRVTYLDLSSAMLEMVRNRLPADLRGQADFIKGDFTQTQLPEASYDLILFVGVLAYVPNVTDIARRLRKLIRPGGLVIAECTDAGHFFGRLNFGYRDLTAMIRAGKCHTFRHRGDSVIKNFSAEGLALKQTFRYTYSVPLLNRLLNQDRRYAVIRRTYGTATAARCQGLGSELLMVFEAF